LRIWQVELRIRFRIHGETAHVANDTDHFAHLDLAIALVSEPLTVRTRARPQPLRRRLVDHGDLRRR
jgi:hypothetical protein